MATQIWNWLTGAIAASMTSIMFVGSAASVPSEERSERTDVVQTADGPVRGVVRHGIEQYLGIPFAAPPVGDLRWQPPQEPRRWSEPLDADRFSKTCVQSNTLGVFAEESLNEDCLYLNVFAPGGRGSDKKRAKPLPVMVWIHGGGWFDGSANEYNAEWLVKKGEVVVVSINYRLNIFGFLAHPALDKENKIFGNYGFMDQQLALKWIRNNISRFGGDSDNVTIFGESAGGGSVMAQIASPAAKGLFHRAIVESGSYVMVSPLQSVREARAYGKDFAKAVGCDDKPAAEIAACLRALTPEQIVKKAKTFTDTAQAIVDGSILPRPIPQALETGKFNKVPVINGANRDELRWLVAMEEVATGAPLTAKDYPTRVRALFGQQEASQILTRYKAKDFGSPSEAFAALQGDQQMLCPQRTMNDALAKYVPVYSYEFADRTAPNPGPKVSFPLGAAHTFEIQYLFKKYNGATGAVTPLDQAQQRLSDTMVSYWTNFARQGDPNGPDTPDWASYKKKQDRHLSLRLPKPSYTTNFESRHRCVFWDKFEDRKNKNGSDRNRLAFDTFNKLPF